MSEDTERTVDDVMAELNDNQRKFVLARLNTRFDRDATEQCGLHEKTPAAWRQRGIPIDEAIDLMRLEAVQHAREALKGAAALAVDTVIAEMRDKGAERVRAALAVLDRIGLPATSKVEGSIEAAGVMIVLDNGETG